MLFEYCRFFMRRFRRQSSYRYIIFTFNMQIILLIFIRY
nr:hypothetical protein CJLB15_00009 [Campylobacter phage CJLB-15]